MDQVYEVLRAICNKVGSPVSERVLALATAGEWVELQKLSLDPTAYGDAKSYWADALCVDLVRKADIAGGRITEQAAVDTFLETERACYSVNRRIRTIIREDSGSTPPSDVAFVEFLLRWKRKIRSVLGKAPEVLEPRFSGGATTSTTRLWSTTIDKLSTTPERYKHSAFEADLWFFTSGWGSIACERGLMPRAALGNEFFVVPKNGLTGRSCCKEASINVTMQLALGRVLRERARTRLGIDLNHGAILHQHRAREGSIFDDLATLDMSSASDRWARELIRFLIDGEWLVLLNATRATHTLFGGKRLYLEKFSSMGNGFTFELETILFQTLALTVQEDEGIPGEILCYGDDLIVPAALATAVLARLSLVGHKPNLKKTHISGPFRESCGGDFFKGEAVNTAKLEKVPKEPQDWISLANNLRRVAAGRAEYWALVLPAWRKCLSFLPRQIQDCRGPRHLGDAVIHDNEDTWPTNRPGYVRTYSPVVEKRELSYYHDSPLATILAMTFSAEPLSKGIPLREVGGYRFRWAWAAEASDWLPGTEVVVTDPRLQVRPRRRWTPPQWEAKAVRQPVPAHYVPGSPGWPAFWTVNPVR